MGRLVIQRLRHRRVRKFNGYGRIATFSLAMIPLFGIGLAGAAHVVAFDLLQHEKHTP